MRCMYCGHTESKVIDSRPTEDGTSIRRRRECMGCGRRFTTYEHIETTPVLVIKKDGSRQIFNPDKIRNGIIKSCEKRPVSMEDIDRIVADIEKQINNRLEPEVSSQEIGETVMNELKSLDEVAYVRFASVYRHFKDINTFMDELQSLLNEQ
ncbi:MAG: transcriptional regulator NrdR [Eubacteriales bacterium]|nr:transcriptional regulator NrdR [Eubacteriales bacterium]